ncbi:hypothetical protein CW310_09555 [Pseudomonas citronellolis]|nr:hypothetical protein CW310_09555 [Pseudomonas citronellolis]
MIRPDRLLQRWGAGKARIVPLQERALRAIRGQGPLLQGYGPMKTADNAVRIGPTADGGGHGFS